MAEVTAKLNRLDISPRKVRSVIRIIAGLPAGEAEAQLIFRKERAARPILKLLKSAVANTKNKNISADSLYIKAIWVNEGPVLKRWLPRARGMATPLHKKFSHVTIVLAEGSLKESRFSVSQPASSKAVKASSGKNKKEVKTEKPSRKNKSVNKEKKEKALKPESAIKKTGSTGATKADSPIKKVFRRKSI